MTDKRYDIAFSGRCTEGADPELVRQRLAKLLKIEADKLKPLFGGKRGVIRKGLDQQQARAYKAAFEKVGAVPEISLSAASAAAPESVASTPAPAETAAAAPPSPPRAPDLTVAEPGVTLIEPAVVAAAEFDLSGFELAEPGVDLVEHAPVAAPEFDLSALALDPPGVTLSETPPPAPANIDTSGLSLAENES